MPNNDEGHPLLTTPRRRSRALVTALLTLTGTVASLPLSPGSAHAAPSGSTYKHSLAGLCLEVAQESRSNGARVQVWTCNNRSHQKWTDRPTGGRWFRIVNVHSGKCLNRYDDGAVKQYTCGDSWGATNDQWQFALQPDGGFTLENRASSGLLRTGSGAGAGAYTDEESPHSHSTHWLIS